MTRKASDAANSTEARYRISDLVAASGVSRDMIKYYLRANLLPSAHKPRPNLSLYTDNHLELIGLIQRFQAQTKLSLEEIAQVFSAAGHNANAIEIELLCARHSVGDRDNIIPLEVGNDNSRGLVFPREFLQELADKSLLHDPDALDENDELTTSLLWAARAAGVPLEFFQETREKLSELADLEVKTLVAIKRPDLDFAGMVDQITDADHIINRWMITEKNRQIKNQFQRVIDNSEKAISTLLDTTYKPSDVFRQRYNIDAEIAQLDAGFDAARIPLQHAHELCLGCLYLNELARTINIAAAILAIHPHDSIAIACISLAHGIQNNADAAFDYGSSLAESDATHPVILEARILALLLKAGKLGGVADTTELMRSAGELYLQLPSEESIDPVAATLLQARANVAFPDFANSRPAAIAALQKLLQQLESDATQLVPQALGGLRECFAVIIRIYTLHYLGILFDAQGDHAAASACFEQVIQLDPASNFGAAAFLKLSPGR